MSERKEAMREAAGVILVRYQGDHWQALLLRNASHGEWGVPKGHRERNDPDLLTCALREVQEETGIARLALLCPFRTMIAYDVEHPKRGLYHKEVTYFAGQIAGDDQPANSKEHDRMEWVALADIPDYIPHANLRGVLQALHEFLMTWPTGG